MSKMAELDFEIRDAIGEGEHPSDIARRLNIPTAWVQDVQAEMFEEENLEIESEDYDDSMDGDHASALASAGFGTDEDYGYYGEDY